MSSANNTRADFGPRGGIATLGALDRRRHQAQRAHRRRRFVGANGLQDRPHCFLPPARTCRACPISRNGQEARGRRRPHHDLVIALLPRRGRGRQGDARAQGEELFYGEDRGDVYAFAHTMVDPATIAAAELGHARLGANLEVLSRPVLLSLRFC